MFEPSIEEYIEIQGGTIEWLYRNRSTSHRVV